MPKKILIVEDEANIRELLRLYLEREGYTVLEAENGVEGIKKWKSDKPDMLLLDVMMPVMDGWEVCREIRAESDVPIIMLTAKGETADRVSGLEMGADDYIVKPITLQSMGEAMHISPYYLSHVFKEMSGYSPVQYLLRRRIGEAQTLLITTELSVTRIAEMVGYDSSSYFNLQFTKNVGMPPNKYRHNYIVSVGEEEKPRRRKG